MKSQNEKETKLPSCKGEEMAMDVVTKDLTNEELIKQYHAEENEIIKSDLRDQFFMKNFKLPLYIAARHKDTSIPMDDLVALSNYGMLKAFNTFELDKDVKFVSYASRVMNNEILMEVRKLYKSNLDIPMEKAIAKDSEGNGLLLEDLLSDRSCHIEDDVIQKELVSKIYQKAHEIFSERDFAFF